MSDLDVSDDVPSGTDVTADSPSLSSHEDSNASIDDPAAPSRRGANIELTAQTAQVADEAEYLEIYRGNQPSTWKYRNRDALECKQSIDEGDNENLSLHLFGAQKLYWNPIATTEAQTRRSGKGADKDIKRPLWRPPKYWTAWPMPPSIVPREPGFEPGATLLNLPPPYINKPVKPSLHLEEMLLAQMMRIAKSQFNAREWDFTDIPSRKRRRGSNADDAPLTDTDNPDSHPIKSAFVQKPPQRPTILTDDTQALSILRPSIRHILSRLDRLLSTLHASRRSYALASARSETPTPSQSRSRSRGRSVRQRSGTPAPSALLHRRSGSATSKADSESDTDANSQSGVAKIERGEEEGDDDDGDDVTGPSEAVTKRKRVFSSQRVRSRARKKKMGQRDWEDVLSFACLSGWEGKADREVVRRAGERCEELFLRHSQGQGYDATEGEGEGEGFMGGGGGGRVTRMGKGKEKVEDVEEGRARRRIDDGRIGGQQQGGRWRLFFPPDHERGGDGDVIKGEGESESESESDMETEMESSSEEGDSSADDSEVDSEGVHIDGFLRPVKRRRTGTISVEAVRGRSE